MNENLFLFSMITIINEKDILILIMISAVQTEHKISFSRYWAHLALGKRTLGWWYNNQVIK